MSLFRGGLRNHQALEHNSGMDSPAMECATSTIRVHAIFTGRVQRMPGDSRSTAIFKQPVDGEVDIGPLGLVGDEQADRRVHGGPDKAVHQFPAETYARLAMRFPDIAAQFVPGSLGENLSSRGADEAGVCIGDRYRLGSALIELSQPRQPCWKIDARHGHEGIAEWIAAQGCAGWYFRVLAPGRCAAGEAMQLVERPDGALPLVEFWRLIGTHRPSIEALRRLRETPGLAVGWHSRIDARIDWLRRNT